MLPSDHTNTSLFDEKSARTPNEQAQNRPTCPRQPERLSLDLDFAKISHRTETSASQPHVLFSPLHYEPGYSYPLFIWLHGHGGDERQVMRIMPILSMRNYVAIAPQGFLSPEDKEKTPDTDPASKTDLGSLDVSTILREARRSKPIYDWPDTENGLTEAERRIFDCIAVAKQRNNIAANKIFLAGFGSGGTMALRLAFLYPENFAGVASLEGAFPRSGHVLHRWAAARNLSVFLGAGETSDDFSPDDACQALELFHTAGLGTTVRQYPCGRKLVPEMLQDLNRWMMNIVCEM